MSLFRRPGEDSSSSSEDSSSHKDDTTVSQDDLDLLSRINTLNSTSTQTGSGRQTPASIRPDMSRNNSQLRDLVLHSLLEEKAIQDAAKHLGKDVSDPEVQKRGRETYQALSRQLSGSNKVDEKYASEEMRPHRATAQEGIEAATRSYLTGLPAASTGDSLALVSQSMATPLSGLLNAVPSPIQLLLQSYPGLHTDHYDRNFVQLDVVGKGGYGKVYKVQHRLDNSLYAVKRIIVGPARLQRIHEHGPQEMEKLLEEVRALARFDHGNIVRYHNAWLEFTASSTDIPIAMQSADIFPAGRLIQDASSYSVSFGHVDDFNAVFNEVSFGNQFDEHDQGYGDIVFEDSDTIAGAEEYEGEGQSTFLHATPRQGNRRASHASQVTVATISSSRSKVSTIKDENGEEDEDVEIIPRTHDPHSQEPTSEFSESMVSNSDVPNHLISSRISGPVLTLNVQMSLYDTSLAAFISLDLPSFATSPELHHCFHPCITLEILNHILSGVEYLHAQGVVHRDLKPANIFLSFSSSRIPPSGSVNLCTCHKCPPLVTETSDNTLIRIAKHITPRIGDFGLVAALGDLSTSAAMDTKPVGTEFYRPPKGGSVSEKLDVYALGIVAFEMLSKFRTRSERVHALMQLRKGQFPEDFVEDTQPCGERLKELLKGMTMEDEKKRLDCESVRQDIENLIKDLRAQAQKAE